MCSFHVQVVIINDGRRVGEVLSAYVEELDAAAKASYPNGGGDSGSSPASVTSSVDQKSRDT